MTLYIDIIFLENVFMNSIILLATGIILKDKTSILRNIISSIMGAIYAIIIYISHIEIYSNIFLKILLSFAIVYVAFNPATVKLFIKHIIIFYLTSFTFGGVAFALMYFVRPQDILFQDGVFIGTYPIKMILAGGIVGFLIITIAFKNIKGRMSKNDMYCNVRIYLNEKYVDIMAIIDTGNFLREPITKMPVIVVEKGKLENIFPNIILENVDNIINGKNIYLGDFSAKIRAIPFKSLGKENGLLLGVKVDDVQIFYQDMEHKITDVIVGIYNGKLSKGGKYSGLVGLDIFND